MSNQYCVLNNGIKMYTLTRETYTVVLILQPMKFPRLLLLHLVEKYNPIYAASRTNTSQIKINLQTENTNNLIVKNFRQQQSHNKQVNKYRKCFKSLTKTKPYCLQHQLGFWIHSRLLDTMNRNPVFHQAVLYLMHLSSKRIHRQLDLHRRHWLICGKIKKSKIHKALLEMKKKLKQTMIQSLKLTLQPSLPAAAVTSPYHPKSPPLLSI